MLGKLRFWICDRSVRGLRQNAVAVAGWLADHQHAGIGVAAVDGLVALARQDFDPLARAEDVFVVLYFEGQLAGQAIKELPRVDVMMPDFTGARRHAFFNNAEIELFDQVPTVAAVTPGVVFGVIFVNWFHCVSTAFFSGNSP